MLNLNFEPFPILITERLILRALKQTDAFQLQQLRSDDIVNQFLYRPKSITVAEASAFIDKVNIGIVNHEWVYWAITEEDENKLVGTICLWNIEKEKRLAEIGYELSSSYQGKGLMKEAIPSVIDFGFNVIKLDVIVALVNPKNKRSITLLSGFHFLPDTDQTYATEVDEGGKLMPYYLLKNVNAVS